MKKQILAMMLIVLLAVSLIGCTEKSGPDSSNETKKVFYSVGTAGTGGAYYPIGIAIANILTNDLGIQSTAEVTGGAAENNMLVNNGTMQLAITQGPMAYAALNGKEPYSEENKNLSALFNGLSKGVFQMVVMGGSDIESLSDLKGKSIAMGPAGGGAINVVKDIFSVYGFELEDVKPTFLSYSEGVDALKDGNVDAAIIQSAAPAAAITQLAATTKDFKIISIENDKMEEILNMYPYYSNINIPSSMYGNDSDADTIYLSNIVVVSKELDEDQVYEMTKVIFENMDKIKEAHPSAKGFSLESAVDRVPIPLHPGAEKYYKERGLLE